MGCCGSKLLSTRDGPAFSLVSGPPDEWTTTFRRSRGLSSQSVTGGVPMSAAPLPAGHSHSLAPASRGSPSNRPPSMSIGSNVDDGLDTDGSSVFTPKVGTSLIFQEASSQDVLCVDGSTAERPCLVSSVKAAAVFKVVATAAKEGASGDLLSLRCTSQGRGSDDSDGFLYFSDLNQKVHCASHDATPLWQLVEPVDDVVAGRRAKEATYVLRVVAQWWFPAVVLRRCHAPSDNTSLSEDGYERHHSITSLAHQAFAAAGNGGSSGGNGKGGGGRGGTSTPGPAGGSLVDESPATAAFARLQNNADNGFSSAFEDGFASGGGREGARAGGTGGGGGGDGGGGGGDDDDDALAFVPVPGEEAFYAVRFRSGVVEAVPVSAMCTAEQMRARSQTRQQPVGTVRPPAAAAAAGGAGNGSSSSNSSSQYQYQAFSPREEVFVGPPFFDGLGQYVCRAETFETPSVNRRSKSVSVDGRDALGGGGGGYASDDDFASGRSSSVDDDFVVSDPLAQLSTPLLRANVGRKPPRREMLLTLRPEMDKALRWNLMMS